MTTSADVKAKLIGSTMTLEVGKSHDHQVTAAVYQRGHWQSLIFAIADKDRCRVDIGKSRVRHSVLWIGGTCFSLPEKDAERIGNAFDLPIERASQEVSA